MRLNGTLRPTLTISDYRGSTPQEQPESVPDIDPEPPVVSFIPLGNTFPVRAGWWDRQHAIWASRLPHPVCLFNNSYHVVKRIFDVSACLALMIVALPVMLVTSILIWIEDPGQVLLAQWRTGRAGRRFKMYKFRTMVKNAEQVKEKYVHLNEHTFPDFKLTQDPRVTRVGYILRKLSLDELPQLFNVLKGDMSLVGPRPTSFSASTYAAWHNERLEVLPGITGLAQVSGRNDVEFDDRIRLDIEYIENRSLRLDLRILMQTLTSVFTSRGAY